MVECQLPKLDVAGSNPVSRSIKSTTYKACPEFLLHNAPLSLFERRFERIHRKFAFFDGFARIDVLVHI